VDCNDNNVCTRDRCIEPSGQCSNDAAVMRNLPCDVAAHAAFDHNVCDGSGVCVKGTPKVCPDLDDCNQGYFDTATGSCATKPSSTKSCNDGNPCTRNDYCHHGQCLGVPVTFSPFDSPANCFELSCNESTGEVVQSLKGGYCYINAMCIGIGIYDPADNRMVCDPSKNTSTYSPVDVVETPQDISEPVESCDGYSAGTPCINTLDLCWEYACSEAGTCERSDISRSLTRVYQTEIIPNTHDVLCSLDTCHSTAVCNPLTGFCDPTTFKDGTRCEISTHEYIGGVCRKGTCTPDVFAPKPQLSYNDCHYFRDGVQYAKPDYSVCDDHNPHTAYSVCIEGSCRSSSSITCETDNPCLSVHHDPVHGCVTSYRDGAPCGEEDLCVSGRFCVSGQCPRKSGHPVQCHSADGCGQRICDPVDMGCAWATDVPCSTCSVDADCPTNPCQRAVCGSDGTCAYVNDDENVSGCVDNNACNGMEFCASGTCYKGEPMSCDDKNPCTRDTCLAGMNACHHEIVAGASCMSADKCSQQATCSADGICETTLSIACDDPPPCKIGTGCNSVSGACEYVNAPDQSPCDIKNPFLKPGQCMSGQCIQGDPKICPPPDTCHTFGLALPDQGDCFYNTKPDGYPCGDDMVCDGGACVAAIKSCEHWNVKFECVEVYYDPVNKTCAARSMKDGTFCDNGHEKGECSKQDVCMSGRCVDQYAAGAVCRPSRSECDAQETCVYGNIHCPDDVNAPDSTLCRSDNFCDVHTCQAGECVYTHEKRCPVGNHDEQCVESSCDREVGACVKVARPDHTPCSHYGNLGPCVDSTECVGGTCKPIYSPRGKSCGPHKSCSGFDGMCITDPVYDCNTRNTDCLVSVYDTTAGVCVNTPLPDYTPCSQGTSECGSNPVCMLGVCTPTEPLNCTFLSDDCGVGYQIPNSCDCAYLYTNPSCHPDHCAGGCTYTYTYWQSYNDYAPVPTFRTNWPDGFALQQLCGKTTYQWLTEMSKGNAWRKLAQAYITAYLNINANDACVTSDIAEIINEAASLLSECQTSTPIDAAAANPYRELVTKIDGYNTGISGPGNCISDTNGHTVLERKTFVASRASIKPLSHFTYHADPQVSATHTQSKQSTTHAPTGFREAIYNESSCEHGDWDYELSECICHYGWGSPDCSICASPPDPTKTFLCVPSRLENKPYILRQIPTDKLDYYLGTSAMTLPFVSIPNMPALFPGTDGYDCFCQQIPMHSLTISRSVAVSVTDHQDLYLYLDIIESDLGICEVTWEGNSSYPEPTYVTVLIQEENTEPWMIASIVITVVFGVVVLLTLGTLLYRACKNRKKSSKRKQTPPKRKNASGYSLLRDFF